MIDDQFQRCDSRPISLRPHSTWVSPCLHDLRTPLTAIVGFSHLLQSEGLSDANRECIDEIVKASDNLQELINDLIELARIDARESPDDDRPVVLCVDSDVDSAALLRAVFAHKHPRLEAVATSAVAADLALVLQPCLILLGAHLADIEGAEMLVRLKADERTRHIPVVVVATEQPASQRLRVMELGAIDCMAKPLDPQRVSALVDLAEAALAFRC